MKGIGGNVTATVQVCTGTTKNEIGELVKTWADAQSIRGWLDLQSGDSRYSNFHAKIQESTHIFIADYVELDSTFAISLTPCETQIDFQLGTCLQFHRIVNQKDVIYQSGFAAPKKQPGCFSLDA